MASQTATSHGGPSFLFRRYLIVQKASSHDSRFVSHRHNAERRQHHKDRNQLARCPRAWSAAVVGSIFAVEFGLGLTHVVVADAECALGECMPREGSNSRSALAEDAGRI
eukprot:scaffold17766_cov54-Attheya_sp.AAC.7